MLGIKIVTLLSIAAVAFGEPTGTINVNGRQVSLYPASDCAPSYVFNDMAYEGCTTANTGEFSWCVLANAAPGTPNWGFCDSTSVQSRKARVNGQEVQCDASSKTSQGDVVFGCFATKSTNGSFGQLKCSVGGALQDCLPSSNLVAVPGPTSPSSSNVAAPSAAQQAAEGGGDGTQPSVVVGAVAGASALVIIGVGMFVYRRRRNGTGGSAPLMSKQQPMGYQQPGVGPAGGYDYSSNASDYGNGVVLPPAMGTTLAMPKAEKRLTVESGDVQFEPAVVSQSNVSESSSIDVDDDGDNEAPLGEFPVICTYSPTLSDELDVQIGDIVVVQREFDDGWCYGWVKGQESVCGVFPRHTIGRQD